MVKTFEIENRQILYPDNWVLTQDDESVAKLDLALQSPNSAMWMLQAFPAETWPTTLVEEAVSAMKKEYEGLEATPIDTLTAMEQTGFGFELGFFCLDFLVTGRVFSFTSPGSTYLLMYQAENREYREAEMVFDAITISLLKSIDAEGKRSQ